MPLTCPTDLTGVDLGFTEFIDCSTINVNYDQLGVASITFVVVSIYANPTPANYTTLVFGGVTFTGYITNLEVKRLPGTLVYEHRYTLVGMGCR